MPQFNQIIFVDDEPSFHETISKYLQKKGYKITSVNSVIDFYKEFTQESFSLAIINFCLPDCVIS
jgi:DNA-binding response OmpR family regulator